MSVVSAQRPAAPLAQPGALATALEVLAVEGWTVLHQLCWPGRLPRPVDLALVGPGGVLVVDVQSWPGAVVDDGVLRVGRRTKDRECLSAAQAGAAVATLLHAEHHDAVRAVLCLTGSAVPVTPLASGALAVPATDLHRWAADLPARLDDDEVLLLSAHLRWQLGDPAAEPSAGAADHQPHEAPAVVAPTTRRALREAERLAESQARLRGRRAISATRH